MGNTVAPIRLQLILLSGETLSFDVPPQETAKYVKSQVAAARNIPAPFWQIVSGAGEVDSETPASELQNMTLNLVKHDRVPFPMNFKEVPNGSNVLLDGVPAIYGYHEPATNSPDSILGPSIPLPDGPSSQQLENSREPYLRFDFLAAGASHPRFGSDFKAYLFSYRVPGELEFGSMGARCQVEWVLPGSDR